MERGCVPLRPLGLASLALRADTRLLLGDGGRGARLSHRIARAILSIVATGVIAASLVAVSAQPARATPGYFNTTSFNLAAIKGVDSAKVSIIGFLIAREHPRVVMLQEVCGPTLQAVMANLSARAWPMHARPYWTVSGVNYQGCGPVNGYSTNQGMYGVAILTLNPPSGTNEVQLGSYFDDDADQAFSEPRVMQCTSSVVNDLMMRTCSTHLHSGQSSSDDRIRSYQVPLVEDYLARWGSSTPIEVGGDFNVTYCSHASGYAARLSPIYDNSADEVDEGDSQGDGVVNTFTFNIQNGFTCKYDYIFYDRDIYAYGGWRVVPNHQRFDHAHFVGRTYTAR
jgi:hypothetical protein